MTQQRTVIRNAVQSLLGGAAIVSAGKVYKERSLAVQDSALPVIVVEWLPPETSEYRDLSTAVLVRTLEIQVELILSDVDDTLLADDVDAYAALIEAALSADSQWQSSVTEQRLTSTDFQKDVHGQIPIGRITLKYQAKYFA